MSSSSTLSAPAGASTSLSATVSASVTTLSSIASTAASSSTSTAPAQTTSSAAPNGAGSAQGSTGISLVAFVTALAASLIVFGIQMGFFLLLRNRLVRILCVILLYPRLLACLCAYAWQS
jgi:hypothetical protein